MYGEPLRRSSSLSRTAETAAFIGIATASLFLVFAFLMTPALRSHSSQRSARILLRRNPVFAASSMTGRKYQRIFSATSRSRWYSSALRIPDDLVIRTEHPNLTNRIVVEDPLN